MNGVLAADLARVGFTGATRILEGDAGLLRGDESRTGQRSNRAALRCFEDHGWPRGSMEDRRERLQAVLMLRPHAHGCRLRARDPRAKELVERRCAARRERHRDRDLRAGIRDRQGDESADAVPGEVQPGVLRGGRAARGDARPRQFAEERFRSTALGASGAEGVRDGAIAELLRRSRVTVADDLTAKYPAAWPVRLTLSLSTGATERAASDYPRGNAENPVSNGELEIKFTQLVASRFGHDIAHSAASAVHSIERSADVATLFGDWGTWERRSTSSLGFNRMAAGVACAEIRRSHRKCRIIGHVWSRSDRWSH